MRRSHRLSFSRKLAVPKGISRAFEIFEEWIPALLLGVMTLAILADVIMRYVFNKPIMGAGETAMFSMVWMVYLGAAAVSRKGAHICLDFFSERISGRSRAIFDIIVEIITIVVLTVITIATFKYMQDARFVPIPGIGLSKQYITLAAAIGLTLMIVHTLVHLARAFLGINDPNYHRVNDPIEEVELEDFDTLFIKTVETELTGASKTGASQKDLNDRERG